MAHEGDTRVRAGILHDESMTVPLMIAVIVALLAITSLVAGTR